MANIEYKTEEEKLGRTDFNSKLASPREIDEDMFELGEKYRIQIREMYQVLKKRV